MTSNKEKYRQFCETETDLPIFMQHWWLEAVCGEDGWDVAICEEKNGITGVFPYPFKKKYFFRTILRPELTPWLGPWVIFPNELSINDKIKFEQKVHLKLIEQLPDFDWLNIDCNHLFRNWKAFYWEGFKQTTKYTSLAEIPVSKDDYFNNLNKEIKKQIKKTSELYEIRKDLGIDKTASFFRKPFERQKINYGLSSSLLNKIYKVCHKNNCIEIHSAVNKNTGDIDAVNLCVWDNKYCYLLLSGSNEQSRTNFTNYLLTYHSIISAWDRNLTFNFEGSMMKNIDFFYSRFATSQISYFNLQKVNSKLLKIFFFLKGQ